MIKQLSIKNYAIIDHLEIEFDRGFSVITGETGSGKSIILGALQLIMGNRADINVIRDKANKCIVEAVFDIDYYRLESFFESQDLDYDAHNTLIRRELQANGKSRAFINDCPVRLEILKELCSYLIDIHSQQQSYLLNEMHFQLKLIDALALKRYDNHQNILSEYQGRYKVLTKLQKELQQVLEQGENSKNQLDYYSFLLEEIEAANLKAGEKEELDTQFQRIENREQVLSALQRVSYTLENNHQSDPINSQLNAIAQGLQKIAGIDSNYQQLKDRLQSLLIDLKEISKDSEILAEQLEVQELNPEQISERLDLINNLEQKHRVIDFNELLELEIDLKQKVSSLSNVEKNIAKIESEINNEQTLLSNLADKLRANRKFVLKEIEDYIIDKLLDLGIKNAQFKIDLKPLDRFNKHGKDQAKFLFTANKGMKLQELSKVASGGESSRLMLCIKALLAKHLNLPTIIFDEIDTGVSGEVAGKVGKTLYEMSSQIQVIAISHLPQVAAQASHHFRVLKEDSQGFSQTRFLKLEQEQRIEELAKMLSGERISEAAIENAKSLMTG